MHGNVREWTQDCYNKNYNGAPSNGIAWTSGDCAKRVLRGGSWLERRSRLNSDFRGWGSAPTSRDSYSGFRLVQGRRR